MSKTSIEWTEQVWNPIRGCSRVSSGCEHCYAERIAARFSGPGQPYEGLAQMTPSGPKWTGKVQMIPHKLAEPLKRRKPTRYFVNSMSDLFHEGVPDGVIMRILNVMALAGQHAFLVLTKRPERMASFFTRWADVSGEDLNDFRAARGPKAVRTAHPSPRGQLFASMLESMGEPPKGYGYPLFDWAHGMLRWPSVTANLWLGCSVEDQATADERIPLLLRCPAAMRFISAEPLLGPIELSLLHTRCPTHDFDGGFCIGPCPDRFGLDWVIVGGESGPGARPMHPDWARAIRDRCVIAGVPFFFKQWGSWVPKSQGWDPRWTNAEPVHRVPKPKEWGCLSYDGTYWKEATTWNGRQEESQDRECIVYRIGKKAAGRLLDGREWNEYPKCYRVVTSRYALRKVK